MTGTLAPNLPTKGDALGTSDKKTRESLTTLRDAHNELLTSENLVEKAKLEKAAKPITWYTPVALGEQTRESTSFGTMATPDEITGVVVPANGLLAIGYSALVKQSVSEAGRMAIFIAANQLKKSGTTSPEVAEVSWPTTSFVTATTTTLTNSGLGVSSGTSFVTTGQILGTANGNGMVYVHRLAAGTYTVSIQFKATSGSVTAKERILWAEVHGT